MLCVLGNNDTYDNNALWCVYVIGGQTIFIKGFAIRSDAGLFRMLCCWSSGSSVTGSC